MRLMPMTPTVVDGFNRFSLQNIRRVFNSSPYPNVINDGVDWID